MAVSVGVLVTVCTGRGVSGGVRVGVGVTVGVGVGVINVIAVENVLLVVFAWDMNWANANGIDTKVKQISNSGSNNSNLIFIFFLKLAPHLFQLSSSY